VEYSGHLKRPEGFADGLVRLMVISSGWRESDPKGGVDYDL
jgi:hypothetical protein